MRWARVPSAANGLVVRMLGKATSETALGGQLSRLSDPWRRLNGSVRHGESLAAVDWCFDLIDEGKSEVGS